MLVFFVFCKEDKSIIKNDNLTKIGILPYNGMEKSYGFTVKILPSIQAPKNAFINLKNLSYRADSLIKYQKTLIKKYKITHILGLCNFDISTTKTREPLTKYQYWGIIGLVYRPGNSCIISPFRLKTNNFERFNKVAIQSIRA